MKNSNLLYLLVFIILFSQCKKDCSDPNPTPVPAQKQAAWVVGNFDKTEYGTILYSPDKGEYWTRQGVNNPELKNINLQGVFAVDNQNAWVAGDSASILKTSDTGNTWVKVSIPGISKMTSFSSISIISSDNIWISGSPGIIINSTDGGNNWTIFDTAFFSGDMFQGIHAVNGDIIYAVGSRISKSKGGEQGTIVRTINAGQSWEHITPPDNYNRNEWIGVCASDPDNVVVHGGHSHYTHTTDGGLSWHNDSIIGTGGTGGADINDLKMLDKNTWWGAFDYDGIYITNDGGANWTNQASVPPFGMWLLGIDYFDRDNALIVGSETTGAFGKIIRTSNGGSTWKLADVRDPYITAVSAVK